ncbi:MAG: FAD-binding oxidoreductase [Anaerolineae bacterium]
MQLENLEPQHIDFLISTVGAEHVSATAADRDQHARDQSFHEAHPPAAVVWPADAEEISAILRYANENRIPVTPWGAGSSLEGNPIPVCGGIVLDLLRLDKILAVRPDDFQVDVQAGVRYKDMNAQLAHDGLFFAPDPGANASIGGMIANNAAGTRTPRYGATKDNVLRLELVTAAGDIIHTGSLAHKSSSAYDLTHLFIGSEGTLGVVTAATLRLAPLPEHFSAAAASFATTEAAARAVSGVMGSGIVPAALEFLNTAVIRELNGVDEFSLPERPSLIMEFHSATATALQEELGLVQAICQGENCVAFEAGLGREERDRLWRVRHQTYEILVRANPGVAFLIVDLAVPVSRFPDLAAACQEAMAAEQMKTYLVGHAGDGNLHPLIPYLPGDEASFARATAVHAQMVQAALRLGGTVTAEHGVGIGKRKYMEQEHGRSLAVMQAIKRALDPNGILNPGKIFQEQP